MANRIGRKTVLLAMVFLAMELCLTSGCQGPAPVSGLRPKIISLAPSITEILFALDLEENIVGITTCCNYPAATRDIEKVATFSGQADLERILALEPDIIFSTGLEQAQLAEKLGNLGFTVALIYPQSLDELLNSIIKIGTLTQKEEQAYNLISQIRQRVTKIKEQVQAIPDEDRPKVFVELCPDPLITAGKGSFVNELIEIAGGKNIARDTDRAYTQFSPEVVLQRNPDYIILGYMQPHKHRRIISERIGWDTISAVKNQQLIADINPDLFLRPGPRIVEGLEQIHARLYH